MRLKVQTSLAIISVFAIFTRISATETICNGTELSVYDDLDIGGLTEKPCTKVFGDIVIANLNGGKRMSNYWTIEELYGSLFIVNTTNLGDSVNLQNLQTIHAAESPALVIRNNRGLRLAIGARLGHVSTGSNITYWFTDNWPAAMTESEHYTLFMASDKNRPVFYTDNHFTTRQCDGWYYKLWTFVFGTLCFMVSCALIGLSFYGRREETKKGI
ncbi:hypothetical protein L5515_007001 [Caenorhabditis briggsae]|uniref:Receptor L-domain domain-containing protein n=1 Tax=Caenorhabditis briggsae TaxID=6238 RepID=A0AAE9F1S3_CAEBR|nr:hypothetical protein L5515_007001 [Caenorhabditis briggsae]